MAWNTLHSSFSHLQSSISRLKTKIPKPPTWRQIMNRGTDVLVLYGLYEMARHIRACTLAVREKKGSVWRRLELQHALPDIPRIQAQKALRLRIMAKKRYAEKLAAKRKLAQIKREAEEAAEARNKGLKMEKLVDADVEKKKKKDE